MIKCQPIREVIRELNTTYFQDKPITLDITIFVLGPAEANVRLVVDRIGSGKMINDLTDLIGVITFEEQERSSYYGHYSLQYGDYYSVESDEECEIRIWREVEREVERDEK